MKRRRFLIATAGLALSNAAWSAKVSYPRVIPRKLEFPRDHGAHPEFRVEWWYVTAYVHGRDGHRYSVFFTLFKYGVLVLPVSQVVDLETGALVGHSELAFPARITSAAVDVATPVAHLRYAASTNTWSFGAATPGYALDLTATPEKPYVLLGCGTGVVRDGSIETDDYTAMQGFVAAGVGVCLIAELGLTSVREDIVIRSLGRETPVREVYAATALDSHRTPATQAMLEILQGVAARYESRRPQLQLVG